MKSNKIRRFENVFAFYARLNFIRLHHSMKARVKALLQLNDVSPIRALRFYRLDYTRIFTLSNCSYNAALYDNHNYPDPI